MDFREKPGAHHYGKGALKAPTRYMILDCETATLPFANEIAGGDEKKKKDIAIAKPLIYDLAWRIVDKTGFVYSEHSFLITETFTVMPVFNTAYYREKRPGYIDKMNKGEITVMPWNDVMKVFMEDLARTDVVGAFNSMFDFKKALPFTDLYISKVNSSDYDAWEQMQRGICHMIVSGAKPHGKGEGYEFDPLHFVYRGVEKELMDIWGIACEVLINSMTYKKKCLEHGMLTNSGEYFKTSAESTYRYLCEQYGFIESHTALEDVQIESEIFWKAAHRAKISMGITYFPFQKLGKTYNFLYERNGNGLKPLHYGAVAAQMKDRMLQGGNKQYVDKLSRNFEDVVEMAQNAFGADWYRKLDEMLVERMFAEVDDNGEDLSL